MDLDPLFAPGNMAVIGVSSGNDRHPANVIFFKNHLRYPLDVYAVNPKGGMLHGEKIYKQVSEIPEKVDLAVIAVRAEMAPDVISDCIRSGVRSGVVISGGFAEVGNIDLQDRIAALAQEASFPFIGPNCLGIYVPRRVDSFFLPIERMVKPEPGNVALVSQSGGILVDLMIKFAEERIGLSRAVSIGNKAVLNELDLLDYFAQDPMTQVLAFYIEGFGKDEGRRFVLDARKCPKPVIVLKSGKSPAGKKAVSSHTASLAGDYQSFSAALAQHGVVEAENELELVSFCESLGAYQRFIDGRIGIITGSGGHGAIAVDACSKRGLTVPAVSISDQDQIREILSENIQHIASINNPVDLTGSGVDEDFVATAQKLFALNEIDCVIVLLLPYLPGITSDIGSKLSSVSRQSGKPLVAYVPHVDKYDMLIEGFELNGVPVSPSIEGAVLMATALRRNKPC
ncbi:MAG TPA: CoA-binding protein [Deltaproteobacteria bacterium]|nr:CoA-binding protein [Deltaproteobacteria bacterium]